MASGGTSDGRVDFGTAVALLEGGRVCAFPTETVYGLGADATDADAVLSIYETKGRPRFNPLIVHCADLEMVEKIATIPEAMAPFVALWPAPLTLVLPARRGILADLVTAGLETVGVRIPDHQLARDLIAAVGRPLAAPSANPSGRLSPTSAGQVLDLFDGAVPVLDGGPCASGVESTILAPGRQGIVQLRPGALSREEIEARLGIAIGSVGPDAPVTAPGMLSSHYAPRAKLRLDAEAPRAGEAWLGFGPGPAGASLSPTGDLREAARTLFARLHELDATGVRTIAVAPIPSTGLGEAINDRLQRAAAPR